MHSSNQGPGTFLGFPKEHGRVGLLEVGSFYRDDSLALRMKDEVHMQPGKVPEPVTVKAVTVRRRVQAPQPDAVMQFKGVCDVVQWTVRSL